MPADQTKLTIYNPKVEPNPRELATATDRAYREEEETTELALRIACEDPTERDHVSRTGQRARARVKAAASELGCALVALLFAGLVRPLLDRSRKKVASVRGEIGRAECSVLALQRLLGAFWVRRLLGRRNLLRMLGARVRDDDGGNPVYSLGLAERRYREGEGFRGQGYASAADSPTTRVVIGIRLAAGEPSWCLKRFMSKETEGWPLIHSCCQPDAESLLLAFYSEPSPTAVNALHKEGTAALGEGVEHCQHAA